MASCFPTPRFANKANLFTRSCILYLIEDKYVALSTSSRIMLDYLSGRGILDFDSLFERPECFMFSGFRAMQNISNLFNSFGMLIICFSHYKSYYSTEQGGRAGIVLGATLLFFVLTLILGPIVGSVIYCAYKVHKVVEMIHSLDKVKAKVLHELPCNVFHRAAAIAAVRSTEETKKACKVYKTSMVVFLVISLIASLALIALTVGIILALFFIVPGAAPVITAAMIGCCAAGASALLVSFLGLWVAIVCKTSKQKECADYLRHAVIRNALSESILCNFYQYHRNEVTREILLQDCLSSYQHLFSQEEIALLDDEYVPSSDHNIYDCQTERRYPTKPSSPPPYPSSPPPPYTPF